MASDLPPPSLNDYKEARLSVLAWLIAEGRLDISVVLSVDSEGNPVPASTSYDYFHPKMGVFYDADGNSMSMYGSVNETAAGWTRNYENFQVNCSWDRNDAAAGRAFIRLAEEEFSRLRRNSAQGWIVLPIPSAAREKLLKYCPSTRPSSKDPLERIKPEKKEAPKTSNVVGAFLRDAPRMPGALWLGAASSTVDPWPHQRKIYSSVVGSYPANYMFCDEVGLGKTIEAGLVLRQLVISKRVKRCLLLVPKAVQKQWQEEMWEKFSLNIPLYSGGVVRDYFKEKLEFSSSRGVWNSFDMLIATSHLAKRAEKRPELLAADRWDLVIVDEAHHARRKDFLNTNIYRPNSLLTLLTGEDGNGGIVRNTECIYLLTATPMQVNPIEVWDLLKVLGMGGKWGASKDSYIRFFSEVRLPCELRDWEFLFSMTKDCIEAGYQIDPSIEEMGESKLGHIQWNQLKALIFGKASFFSIHNFSDDFLAVLDHVVRSTTPIRGMMWRNTRNLLREYRSKGLLDDVVPIRIPRNQWIELIDTGPGSEWELYTRIEEYISNFYRKYEQKRKGLGFVMTVYRKRLTSSFYAFEKSMERRLDFLNNRISSDALFTDEDIEEESLFDDIDEDTSIEVDLEAEKVFVEQFLTEIRNLSGDSKYEQLSLDVKYFFNDRDSLIVFTQYTDTMDYLREKLRVVYGGKVACYSGRGGERWNGTNWITVPKEEIKNDFRAANELKILLCTESASEGLNLQTCGVLINYDMPWNPMKVEQRIGRIDRIGQRYEKVQVRNFFIKDTVEARVYQRLEERIGDFTTVVGRLQPILHGIEEAILAASMTPKSHREKVLETKLAEIERQLDDTRLRDFDLTDYVESSTEVNAVSGLPATLSDIEEWLVNDGVQGVRLTTGDEEGLWNLIYQGNEYTISFRPELFDKYPSTVQMLTWGNPILESIFSMVRHGKKQEGKGFLALHEKKLSAWYRADAQEAVSKIKRVSDVKGSEAPLWTQPMIQKAESDFQSLISSAADTQDGSVYKKQAWLEKKLSLEAMELLQEAILLKAEDLYKASPGFSNTLSILKDTYASLVAEGYPWKGIASIAGTVDGDTASRLAEALEELTTSNSERRTSMSKLSKSAERILTVGSISDGNAQAGNVTWEVVE